MDWNHYTLAQWGVFELSTWGTFVLNASVIAYLLDAVDVFSPETVNDVFRSIANRQTFLGGTTATEIKGEQ